MPEELSLVSKGTAGLTPMPQEHGLPPCFGLKRMKTEAVLAQPTRTSPGAILPAAQRAKKS